MTASDISLKEHFETTCKERTKQYDIHVQRIEERVDQLERAVGDRFDWIEKMTQTVAATMEKRLEGMNEFRDSLKDQASRFITRDELSSVQKLVDADVRVLRESKAQVQGMATQADLQRAQKGVTIGYIFAAINAIGVLVAVILSLLHR